MPEDTGTNWMQLLPEERRLVITKLMSQSDVHYGMYYSLSAYILDGVPVGHFLEAVLTNDLKEACARADDDNKGRLWNIVYFLYNHAPKACWGSEERYQQWVRWRGFNGLETARQHAEDDLHSSG